MSEAAGLADVFVFRLMFRLYALPRAAANEEAGLPGPAGSSALFYERKRLLSAFAARRYARKVRRDGRMVETIHYLMLSALALDTRPGACSALEGGRCAVYERRPLACRSVPTHYSAAEGAAGADLAAFVATPGFACDTGESAPVYLEGGRIVDEAAKRARADALALAERERPWQSKILARMKRSGVATSALPGLDEVEANAAFGATTTSMRLAWQVAADEGLLGAVECRRLIETQKDLIDRELAAGTATPDARETLLEMRAEYRDALAS